jgi:type IV pilus assembly protein PilX
MAPLIQISSQRRVMRRAQRGVVLFIALIVLVAMTMAGVAIMRSTDTNSLIAGNLVFKSAAASAGDAAIEAARAWMSTKTAGELENNQPGYFASWDETFDPKSFNWNAFSVLAGAGFDPSSGNTIRYVTHRMCQHAAMPISNNTCAKVSTASPGSTKGGGSYGVSPLTGSSLAFYRITARIEGPKYTVSYIQAFLY